MIDLAFKFLHVTMRDILIARILLVGFAELLIEPIIRLFNLLINLFEDSFNILAFAYLDEDTLLEGKHGLLNDFVVEVHHV